MKKALTILLAVLLVVTLALGLTACSPCKTGLHDWDDGVITTPATCEHEGEKTVTCNKCGEPKTETLPKADHAYGTLHEATDTTIAYYQCSVCNKYFNESKQEVASISKGSSNPENPDEHTQHDYTGKTWISDGNGNHYMDCVVCNEQGRKSVACSLSYAHEGEQHWQECSECDYETAKSAHDWDEGKVEQDATCEQDGLKTVTCNTCKDSKQVTIPKSDHEYGTLHDETDTTIAYYQCAVCHKYFNASKQEVSSINKDAQQPSQPSETTLTLVVGEIAKANNWADASKYAELPTGDSNITVSGTKGTVDPTYYEANGGTWRVYKSGGQLVITAGEGTELVSVQIEYLKGGFASKITKSGDTYTVTEDERQEVVFTVGSDTVQISKIVIVYKSGLVSCTHEWEADTSVGDNGWSWSVNGETDTTATLSLKCGKCDETMVTEPITATYAVTVQPTCITKGTGTYTVNYKEGDVDETGTKTVEIDEIAHDYQPTYDEDGHYNQCTTPNCGAIEGGDKTSHNLVYTKIDDNNHSAACQDCAYTIQSAEHSWSELPIYVNANKHETRCTAIGCTAVKDNEDHSYTLEDNTKCACGAEQNHEHDYTEQHSNEQGHWMECPIDHEKDGEPIAHVSSWVEYEGGHREVCSTCGYEMTAKQDHAYTSYTNEGDTHSGYCETCQTTVNGLKHSYDDVWTNHGTENYHYRSCKQNCGKVETQEHEWCENPTNEGTQHKFTCTVDNCGAEEYREHDFADGTVYKPVDITHHAVQCTKCDALNTADLKDCDLQLTSSDSAHFKACAACGNKTEDVAHSYSKYNQTCECGKINPVYLVEEKEANVLATFTMGDGKSGTADTETYIETVGNYTLTITRKSGAMYPNGKDGSGNTTLRLGKSGNAASMEFTVPQGVSKVVIYVARYSANKEITITINGQTVESPTSTDYIAIAVDTSTIKTILMGTNNYCYIDTIEYYSAPSIHEADLTQKVDITDATCDTEGTIAFKCTTVGCNETHTKTIAAVGHTYEFVKGEDAKCGQTGTADHWKCTVCNKLFEHENDTETWDPTIKALEHVMDYRVGADEHEGQHQEYCTLECGYEGQWESHSAENWVIEDKHYKLCEACSEKFAEGEHVYDQNDDTECVCGKIDPNQHQHDFDGSTVYLKIEGGDTLQHAKKCKTCNELDLENAENCTLVWSTNTETHKQKCDYCDRVTVEESTHEYSEYIGMDDEYHGAECDICGETNYEMPHNFSKYTPNDKGGHDAYCDVCEETVEQEHDAEGPNESCSKCKAEKEVEKTEQLLFTILPDIFTGSSYVNCNKEYTIDNAYGSFKFTSYQVMQQSGAIQFQKSKGYITSTGAYTKIVIASSAGTFTVSNTTGSNGTYTCSNPNVETEYKISVGSDNLGTVSKIEFYGMV